MPGVGAEELRVRVVLEVLEIDVLRPHERTRDELLAQLTAEIRRDGVLKLPVLVEQEHHVILDGHHRYEALRRLGSASQATPSDAWGGANPMSVVATAEERTMPRYSRCSGCSSVSSASSVMPRIPFIGVRIS